jgi:thiamine biosynthesis lipoprotein
MHLLALDRPTRRVAKLADGLVIDLGGIGKGYAVDQAAAILREWGVAAALIHSGQSSLYALGAPLDGNAWTIAVRDPADFAKSLGTIAMRDAALSGSGVLLHGRHIIDPRTGEPAGGDVIGACALAASAALSDAASTAFMVMSPDDVAAYCGGHADVRGLVCLEAAGGRVLRDFEVGLRPSAPT